MLTRPIWLVIALCMTLSACFPFNPFTPKSGKGRMAEERFKQSEPVIAALQRYYQKHGAYPDTLSSLVPDELNGLPHFSVKNGGSDSLGYHREGTSYVLEFRYVQGGMNTCIYQPPKGWLCGGYM